MLKDNSFVPMSCQNHQDIRSTAVSQLSSNKSRHVKATNTHRDPHTHTKKKKKRRSLSSCMRSNHQRYHCKLIVATRGHIASKAPAANGSSVETSKMVVRKTRVVLPKWNSHPKIGSSTPDIARTSEPPSRTPTSLTFCAVLKVARCASSQGHPTSELVMNVFLAQELECVHPFADTLGASIV